MNRFATALLAGAVTVGAASVLRGRPPGDRARWRRTNYRGREVDLLGGVASAVGAVTGGLAVGGAAGAAAGLVTTTAGVLGGLDDADTSPTASSSKGLRGHLHAAARGEITTGLAKLVGISGSALVAAAVATGAGARGATAEERPAVLGRAGDVLGSGVLIAATANLVNLCDLRPGRALKIVGGVAAPLALLPGPAGRLAGAAVGTVAASWEADLAEETMLGDAGANALGALLGTALALLPSARVRGTATVLVVGLVLLSEKVSFSRVIATTPGLRELDAWGRNG